MNIRIGKLGIGLILAAIFASIGGCGGGGGDDNVSSPPPPPPPPSGGIVRTGIAFSVGPITGFGSVIVNGTTYATNSNTTYTVDGEAATEDDFSVGQVVIIKGTIDDDNTNAVAESVEFDDNVEGPVTAVVDANTLIVMGQTVRTSATTSIDNSCPASLDDPSVFAVEVSGIVDAGGVIQATRIECKFSLADVGEFEVNGIVSDHQPGAMTFMINALQVNYSSAMIDNFPGGAINNGDPVEAKGTDFDSSGDPDVLTASRVEFKGARFADDEGDHIEIEGFITRFVSPTNFDVSGVPVTEVAGTTVYEGGTSADLGLNLKVEVEGDFDASGVLNATEIEIKTSTNTRVTGQVDSVSGDVITILGIPVNTSPTTTRFEDKRDDVDPFRVGNIATGDYIEARGQELPEGEITASLIERDDLDSDTELRGIIEDGSVDGRNSFRILGVTVATGSVEAYYDDNEIPISADAFWAAVGTGGVLVDVDGRETGDTELTARELELESE